jgi:hypothetical protein
LRLARDRADAAKAPAWLDARIAVELARAGALDEARAMAAAIARDMDAASVEQRSGARWLDGEIALCQGRLVPALEALVLADHERRSAFTVASLARAYRLAGDTANASRFYEILASMKDLATGFEPQQAWLDGHVRLAEIYASAGDAAKAQATLAPLLELWKEADEDLPLRRDALRLSQRVVPSRAAARPAGVPQHGH